MRPLSLLAFLLPISALAASTPDWVQSGGKSLRYGADAYLIGFAMAPTEDLDAAKREAAADLATRITVRIEHEASTFNAEKNGAQSYAVSSLTRATTDVRLSGLAYETFTGNGHAYALAYRARDAAAQDERDRRNKAAKHAEELIASAQKAEQEKRESDALSSYYQARVAMAEAAEHDAIAYAILRGASDGFELSKTLTLIDDRVRLLLKKPVSNLTEVVAALAVQLAQQGVTKQAKFTVAPLTFGTTSFSSVFGKEASLGLERALFSSTGTAAKGDLVVRGTYVPDGETWRLRVLVKEALSGAAIASAEATVPKAAIPTTIPTLPQNFDQAQKDEKLLAEGEGVSGDLRLEVWTNKGRTNLVYSAKDELTIHMRVNRPAYVRLVYLLADGRKVPIEQAYFIDASKVNMAIEYPDKFEISAPFGVERLYAVAFTEKPEAMRTKHVQIAGEEYDIIAEATEGLVKHRGIQRKKASLQTAEATVALTTTP